MPAPLSGTAYIFALGFNATQQPIGDYGFDPVSMMLTTDDNGDISYVPMHGESPILWQANNPRPGPLSLFFDCPDVLDWSDESFRNYVWAVIVIDDAMPDRYGLHIFSMSQFDTLGDDGATYSIERIRSLELSQYAIIPEPTTASMVLAGLAALLLRRKRPSGKVQKRNAIE